MHSLRIAITSCARLVKATTGNPWATLLTVRDFPLSIVVVLGNRPVVAMCWLALELLQRLIDALRRS